MCFSAAASFAGGAVASTVGVVTVRKARRPEQRLFSVIPLLFGFQQVAEGVLWVTLKSGEYNLLQNVATYAFLIMALIGWPLVVPLSMWLMEKGIQRKKALFGLMIAGGIVSLYYAFNLISYDVTPQVVGSHIQYVDNFPAIPVNFIFLLYLASTVVPLFVSSVKRMWLFGGLITVSLIVTAIFFTHYLASTWCFFAALSSVVIYFILRGSQTETSSNV